MTEVMLFTDQKAFEGVCDFLESANVGFDIPQDVYTCMEKPVDKNKKLKVVKK